MLLFFLFVSGDLYGQWTGDTGPRYGETYTYSYTRSSTFGSSVTWQPTGGTVISSWLTNDKLTANASIRWHSLGSQTLTVKNGTMLISTLNVTVVCPSMSPPTFTIRRVSDNASASKGCTNESFIISATVGAGGSEVRWYSGQADVTPFHTENSFTTGPISTSTQTYWISTYYTSGGGVSVESTSASEDGQYTTSGKLPPPGGGTVCESSKVPVTLYTYPPPQASIANEVSPICSGTSFQLFITNMQGLTGVSYTWTAAYPAGLVHGTTSGSGSQISQTLINTSNVPLTATFYAQANGNGCSGPTTSTTVVVKPRPAVSFSGGLPICSNQTASISIHNTNNVSGTTFSWTATQLNVTGASGGSGSSILQTLTNTSNVNGTATYTITSQANGCSGASTTAQVTVKPRPVVSITNKKPSFCSGEKTNITLGSGVSGATYSWSAASSNVSGASASSGALIAQQLTTSSSTGGSVSYVVTPTANGCAGGTASTSVAVKPLPTVSAENERICSGERTSIAIMNPNNVAGTTFNWTARNASQVTGYGNGTGSVIEQLLQTTSTSQGFLNYSINGTANGCAGPLLSIAVYVDPLPSIPIAEDVVTQTTEPVQLQVTNLGENEQARWYETQASTTPVGSSTTFMTGELSLPLTTWFVAKGNTLTGCEGQRSEPKVYYWPPAELEGDAVVLAQEVDFFTFTFDDLSPTFAWVAENGVVEIDVYNPDTHQARAAVRWTSPGPGKISLIDGTWIHAEKGVTVVCPSTPPPSVTDVLVDNGSGFTSSPEGSCGPGNIKLVTAPGANADLVDWYDVEAGGTARTAFETVTGIISATKPYYIVSRNSLSGCTSSPRLRVDAKVRPVPTGLPDVSDNGRFGQGPLTIQASGTTTGGTYQWQLTETGAYTVANSYTTVSLSENRSNYVTVTKRNIEGCTGQPVSVDITIEPPPGIDVVDNYLTHGNPAILRSATAYDSYTWRNNAGTVIGSASELVTQVKGIYTLSVTKDGITGTGISSPVSVDDQLAGLNMNYIIETTALKPNIVDFPSLTNEPIGAVSESIQYFDGLGMPMQSVITQWSPGGLDIIQPVIHDGFGRKAYIYQPVTGEMNGRFKANLIDPETHSYQGPLASFYAGHASGTVASDSKPYAHTIFEEGPVGRIIKQGAEGEAWQPTADAITFDDKTVKMRYSFNTPEESVLLWRYDAATHRISAEGGLRFYQENSLAVKKLYDQHNNLAIEYADNSGRVVLKRVQATNTEAPVNDANYASTYYIYDDFGNLVCVLQPEGVKNLSIYHTADATNQEKFLSNWAFRNKYDGRKRMIEKQVPGAQAVYMVYDDRDRLVLTQDGKLRGSRMWSFTKYDQLNRPILTGIKDTSVTLTQGEMQAVVDTHYNKPGAQYSESFVGDLAGNIHGYSNNTYPIDTRSAGGVHAHDYLTVTYYDGYDFKANWSTEFEYADDGLSASSHGVTYTQSSSEFTRTKGLVTGTRIKVLDGGIRGGYVWLNNVSYYDDRYQVIQTISENYYGGVDRTSNLYDFTGKVIKTKTTHSTGLITWKALNGTAIAANKLYKNISGSGWNTAGAASEEQLSAQLDGWIEVTVSEANHNRMIGLSDENPDDHYNTIDFTFYLNGSTLRIYESGSLKYTVPGGILPADRLRIARTGNIITYYRNGELVYTSLTPSASLLMVDASLSNPNSSLLNVRASFSTKKDSITRRFDYDHAGRLTHTWHQLNNDPKILLSRNEYNELGQLIDKKIHSTVANATDAKQSIDYRYNIRGWLTKMNETDLTSDDPGDPADYFSFELGYNNDIGIGNQALYNGNISGMKWSSNLGLDAEKMKGYVYDYDPMNRIADATYKTGVGNVTSLAWATAAGNAFSEYGYTYDLNGNIKTLKRKGPGGSDMDILQYSYGGGFDQGNKLNYVTDSGIDTTGFKELNAPGYDYSYDTNGNLRWDKNKGGKDLLTNADFQAGASGWTAYDPGSRLSFPGPSLLASPGTDSATITQQDVIQPNSRVLVFIELEHLSGAGSVNLNIGGTDVFVSVSGLNTIPVYAGGGTSVTITPSTDFDGYIHNVQVKGYAVFEYNFLNLPEEVTMGGDQYLMYYYDATGRKLTQELYKSDKTLLKRSDYIGEYFYENDTLKFINHEEGRVVMTGSEPEYQYHLKDHLGNVRLTFTTKDEIEETTATLEPDNLVEEQGQYLRYENARRVQATLFDRTNGASPGYSQRLNGTANEKYGLAKSISVMPGDVINTEVYAKYVDTESSNWTQALMDVMGAIAANTGGIVVDGGNYAASTSSFSYGGFVNTSGSSSTAPKAFLNWIVFDRDFNMLDGGFTQITTAAKETGTDIPHQRLFKDNIAITKPGYVYIYLSNENETPVEVFFDDFKVVHTKSPVVQMDDYYPFGLTFNSYSRENSVSNKYLYSGKERQSELDLGWFDYGARFYDPTISRWMVIDPSADSYFESSPYNYVFNNPVCLVDPDGMDPEDVINAAMGYIGTNYEWGGKNPTGRLIGAKDRLTSSGLFQLHTSSSLELKRTWGRTEYNSTRADIYNIFGVQRGSSFGIDCSGLVAKAFNADADKLMGDLIAGTANDQMESFAAAEISGTGALHNDFNLLGKGDIVFSLNKNGNAHHTMVATGDVKTDKNGNVKKYKTIEATESGDKVRTKWRKVGSSQQIGHTYRKTDEQSAGPVRDEKDKIKLSGFVKKHQNVN